MTSGRVTEEAVKGADEGTRFSFVVDAHAEDFAELAHQRVERTRTDWSVLEEQGEEIDYTLTAKQMLKH